MRTNRFMASLALGTAAIIVIAIGASGPVRTQERGTPVIVANTPAEPVPTEVVNRGPLDATVTNDPRRPLFIAPGQGAEFDVCPVSCGAYEADVSSPISASTGEISRDFDVPPSTRFTIRHAGVLIQVPQTVRVVSTLTVWFASPNGPTSVVLPIPLGFQGVLDGWAHYAASLPVHLYHDDVGMPGTPLKLRVRLDPSMPPQKSGHVYAFISGNLEPVP